jgi:probable HAF family extracellular repeat protein
MTTYTYKPTPITGIINDSDQIVGTGFAPDGTVEIKVYDQNNNLTTFDEPGWSSGSTHGINDSGQISGIYTPIGSTSSLGFVLDPNGTVTTISVPSADETAALGINNLGQIVGWYSTGNTEHGFLYSNGTYTTLDDPASNHSTNLVNINDSGQIVGQYFNSDGSEHSFLYSGGTFTPIDVPGSTQTRVHYINNSGEIVGSYDSNNATHGFIYQNGVYTSFDYPGATSTFVGVINNNNQISFDAIVNGVDQGFIATPVNGTTWTNPGTSGNWSTGTNWTGGTGSGGVPGTGDSVTLGNSSSTYIVTVDVNTQNVASLQIGSGGAGGDVNLTINPGVILSVTGDVTTDFGNSNTSTITMAGNGSAVLDAANLNLTSGASNVTGAGTLDVTGTITGGTITAHGLTIFGTLSGVTLAMSAFSGLDFEGTSASQTPFSIPDTTNLIIGSTGSLTFNGTETIDSGGSIRMRGGTLANSSGAVTINGGIEGYGTVSSNLTGNNLHGVDANLGTLNLTGTVGTGVPLAIVSGAVLELGNTVASGDVVTFLSPSAGTILNLSGSSSTIAGGDLNGFQGTIVGLNAGAGLTPTTENAIDLSALSNVTGVSLSGGNNDTLTVTTGSGTFTLALSGDYSRDVAHYTSDGHAGTYVFLGTVPPAVSFIGPVVDAAADTTWPVNVSGLGGQSGSLVFSDKSGDQVSVNLNGDGTYLVNLSSLVDGAITSTISTGGQSASGGPLTLVGAPLPKDAHITLSPSSTGDLGKVGGGQATVIDAAQTTNITFTSGNGSDTIVAGVGDTVHGGNSSDTLVGANGATLYAGNGPNLMYGAPGETLVAGSGKDTFAFEPGSGQNTISNFQSNDIIQFNPALFMNYANMLNSGAITQSGANTVINDHAGDTVTLLGVAASSLTANNFSFKA